VPLGVDPVRCYTPLMTRGDHKLAPEVGERGALGELLRCRLLSLALSESTPIALACYRDRHQRRRRNRHAGR